MRSGRPSFIQHRRQRTYGPCLVLATYISPPCASSLASHEYLPDALLTSPSTSLIVSSQCSRLEIFHFTHTLCIQGFYSSSRQMSLFASLNWSQVLINGLIGKCELTCEHPGHIPIGGRWGSAAYQHPNAGFLALIFNHRCPRLMGHGLGITASINSKPISPMFFRKFTISAIFICGS